MKTHPSGQEFCQFDTGLRPLPAHHVVQFIHSKSPKSEQDEATKAEELKRLIEAARTVV